MFNLFRRQRARLMRVGYIKNILHLRPNARLYLVSAVLGGLGFSVYQLFFNLYVESLGESRQFLGVLQSLSSAVTFVVGIPAGLIGDRFGRRMAMLLGGGGGLFGLSMFLLMPDRPMMVLWSGVYGASNTLFFMNIAPFLTQNSSDDDRAFLFSADWSLMMLAAFVGSLIAGAMPAAFARRLGVGPESAEAYRAAMFLGVGLNLLALVPLWMTREVRWPRSRRVARVSPANVFRLKAPVVKLMLPNLVIGFGAALLIPYMNLFFKETFPITDQTLGTIFAPRELFTAVASMAAPVLAMRLGKIRSVVFTQLGSVAFLLMLGFVPVLTISVFAFWMRGALMNMGHPLYRAFMMEQSPKEERGTVNSIVEMAWQVGWVVGPVISGAVQTRAGFAPLFLATSAFYAIGIGLTYAFFHAVEENPTTEDSLVEGGGG
jgi:MFS family permease